MPLTGSIEDRLEIHELYGRYGNASSRADREGWLGCWAPDGQWHSHIFQCDGIAAIADQYDTIMAMFDGLFFLGALGTVEIDGTVATAQSSAMEIGNLKQGGFFKLCGTYEDKLEKRAEGWVFRKRVYTPIAQDF